MSPRDGGQGCCLPQSAASMVQLTRPALLCLLLLYLTQQVSPRPLGSIKCYQLLERNEGDKNHKKRQIDCPNFVQGDTPNMMGRAVEPMNEEQREEKKRKMFEGLLHFATVVNHVDSFIMDKGKLFLKSLGKMVASEEDPRFDM